MRAEKKFRGIFGWNDSPSKISWTLPTQAFDPQNVLKRACSVPVCEVKLFLKNVGKNPSKASYWSLKAKRRHFWTDADLTQEPRGTRGRKRAGGREEWMARKRVLKKMCEDIGT